MGSTGWLFCPMWCQWELKSLGICLHWIAHTHGWQLVLSVVWEALLELSNTVPLFSSMCLGYLQHQLESKNQKAATTNPFKVCTQKSEDISFATFYWSKPVIRPDKRDNLCLLMGACIYRERRNCWQPPLETNDHTFTSASLKSLVLKAKCSNYHLWVSKGKWYSES